MFNYQDFEDALITHNITFIFEQLYSPKYSETYIKLQEELKAKEEQLRVQKESQEEHFKKGIAFPTHLSELVAGLEEEIKLMAQKVATTNAKPDNLFYVADAIDEIQREEKEPLENNASNRAMVSNILRDKYQRIEINPHNGEVQAVTKFPTMEYATKIIDGKEEEVFVPTKARSLKKKYIVEWFDMFEKDFDDCDRGGFCAAHATLDGKRKRPKESDWFWKWYEEELLWR